MANPAQLQAALDAADCARISDDETTSDSGFAQLDPIRYLDFEPIGREHSGGGLFYVAMLGGEEALWTGIVLYGPDLPGDEHDNL